MVDEQEKKLIEEHNEMRDSPLNNLNLEPKHIFIFTALAILGYWIYTNSNKVTIDYRIMSGILVIGFIIYYLSTRSQNYLITMPMARAMVRKHVEDSQRDGELPRGKVVMSRTKFDDNPGKERYIQGLKILEPRTNWPEKFIFTIDARRGRGVTSESDDHLGFHGDETLFHN